ncbi:MAG: CYTH domain-containing protein [Flavobacteriia bacterium]
MEIERKFLVKEQLWEAIEKPSPSRIVQAYLLNSPEKTVRIRIKGTKGFLTIKGPTQGISRAEFEYEIPLKDADELISTFAEKVIEKFRYEISFKNHLWEVDVFTGKLEGLYLAEIELNSEDEHFELPDWVGEEVSTDPNYYNSNLINKV